MKLLHLDASVLGDNSVSRQLSAAVVARFTGQIDGLQVDYRDLDANPVPHLRSSSLAKTDAAEATDAEQVMQQFLEADIVVIGAPMYNFSIPSTLKAWIDRVAVVSRTFKYTENGPVGLAGGKRVIIASSRGGIYTDSPTRLPGAVPAPGVRLHGHQRGRVRARRGHRLLAAAPRGRHRRCTGSTAVARSGRSRRCVTRSNVRRPSLLVWALNAGLDPLPLLAHPGGPALRGRFFVASGLGSAPSTHGVDLLHACVESVPCAALTRTVGWGDGLHRDGCAPQRISGTDHT